MAIQPPSDIVLDVAMSANPVRLQAAMKKLADAGAPDRPGTEFSGELAMIDQTSRKASGQAIVGTSGVQWGAMSQHAGARAIGSAKVASDFEALLLQNSIEAMLPQAKSIFGKGTAGSIWKSLLSRELACALTKAGGIGLSHHIEAALKSRALHSTAGGAGAVAAISG